MAKIWPLSCLFSSLRIWPFLKPCFACVCECTLKREWESYKDAKLRSVVRKPFWPSTKKSEARKSYAMDDDSWFASFPARKTLITDFQSFHKVGSFAFTGNNEFKVKRSSFFSVNNGIWSFQFSWDIFCAQLLNSSADGGQKMTLRKKGG